MNSKGISEVLGYILILSIVILITSVAFVYSYSVVSDTKERVKFESMNQGFRKIQNMVEYSAYSKNPKKSIRLLVNEGMVTVKEQNEVNITVKSNDTTTLYSTKYNVGLIEYEFEDYRVAFENGGVWQKSYDGGVSIVSEPRIFIYRKQIANEMIVFVALIRIQGNSSVGGYGFVNIEVNFNSSETRAFNQSGYIYMNMTTEYAGAWNSYFERLRSGLTNNTVLQTSYSGNLLNVSIYYDNLILTEYVLDAYVDTSS
jgi:competence protein ComGC